MNPRPNNRHRAVSGGSVTADRPRGLPHLGLVNAGLVTGSLILGAAAIALWGKMVF